MEKQTTKMPRALQYLWWGMTVAYTAWMCVWMRWDTYTPENTLLEREMYADKTVYLFWVAGSVLLMIAYPILLEKLLYAKQQTKTQKLFCLGTLLAGCAYITAYGFLKSPIEYTASMMGLYYPWLFKG